ncbi:MAG: mechanosensitive ion channel [Rhodospirillaceae bacterium]|jgi:small conductance mechanosensitive channel|nr:mechanosensitive ion channel [Rhodospirillaceae bacterium]MBT7756377.1 mechanosensitive ion channel [Rhodospirillaceae bacterium]
MQNLNVDVSALAEDIYGLILAYGLDILGAIVILAVGWWIAGKLERTADAALARVPHMDATLRPFVCALLRYAVIAVTLVAVLSQFGVETTSIIAVLGAAGLAIGLALQGTLQNIAAGVMLLLLRPFKVGDYIDAGSIDGTVEKIGLFITNLKTVGGLHVSAPNSQLWNTAITNYSRNTTRRIDITVGIGYDDDMDQALARLLALMADDARTLDDPGPQTKVVALGASSVDLSMRCWCNSGDYWELFCDLNKATKETLDQAGISIPYPQQDVHIHQVAALPPD